jgi:hypothetical protein
MMVTGFNRTSPVRLPACIARRQARLPRPWHVFASPRITSCSCHTGSLICAGSRGSPLANPPYIGVLAASAAVAYSSGLLLTARICSFVLNFRAFAIHGPV